MLEGIAPQAPTARTAQLVKSLISHRTSDEIAAAAYERLRARYRRVALLAAAARADERHSCCSISSSSGSTSRSAMQESPNAAIVRWPTIARRQTARPRDSRG